MLKRYRFGAFRLDLNLRALSTEDGKSIELTPKAMAVLAYLIENRERVVSKDELLSNVWSGTLVNDSVVHVNISNIRNALHRHGGRDFIKTSSTQGYRFAEAVEEWSPGPVSTTVPAVGSIASPETKTDGPALHERPRFGRTWLTVSAVAALLVIAFVCLEANQYWHYVHSPRYIATKILNHAILSHNMGHDQESIELARKAIEIDPSLVRGYLLAAWWETLNQVEDRTIQTVAILDQLKAKKITLSPTEAYLEEGIRRDNDFDSTEAERLYREATALSPGDTDAWRMYGYGLDGNYKFEDAILAFRKCLSIDSADTDCAVGQLQSQNALSQFDRSIELFNSLHESVKQTPWVVEEFGYAQLGKKRYKEAQAAFELENRIGQSANEPSAIDGSIDGRVQTMLLLGDDPVDVATYLENQIQKYDGPPLQKTSWELTIAAIDATTGRQKEGTTHVSNALVIADNWQLRHKTDLHLLNVFRPPVLLAMCRELERANQQASMISTSETRELAAVKLFIKGMGEMGSPSTSEGAAKTFLQAYDNDPSPLYDFYRAQALLRVGDASAAKQALQRFLEHRGNFQEDYIGFALLIPAAEKDLATIKD